MTDQHDADTVRPPLRARIARSGVKLGFGLGVAAAVAGMVMLLQQRAGAGIAADPQAPLPVLAAPLERAPGYAESRRFAGRIEPARTTAVGFERAGLLAEVAVREGDAVAEGDVLARLDTALIANERDRLAAVRDRQAAAVDLAQLTYDRHARMTEKSVSPQRLDELRLELRQARAGLAETEAALERVAIELEKSAIRAPFAGRIGARSADEGVILEAGTPVVELLETGRPRARIGLAPDAAEGLAPGAIRTLQVDGRPYRAELAALRPDLDTASRTVVALFDLHASDPLPAGAMAVLELDRRIEQPGYWVPLGALVEGSRGLWSVYVVARGAEGPAEVGRELVQVAHVEGDRAFVTGSLRPGMRVVLDGTHRVRPGQDVRVASAGE